MLVKVETQHLGGVNSESLKTSKKGIKMVVMFVIVCSEIDHDE